MVRLVNFFSVCGLDADSEEDSVKDEPPQITSVTVDQTVHTFAE